MVKDDRGKNQPVTYYELMADWIDPCNRLSRWNRRQQDTILWLDNICENYPRRPELFDFKSTSPNLKLFNEEINQRLSAVGLPTITLPESIAEDTVPKLTVKIKQENRKNFLKYIWNIQKFLYFVGGLRQKEAYEAIRCGDNTLTY